MLVGGGLCGGGELSGGGAQGGEDSGGGCTSSPGELVAVGTGDFVDEAVGTEESQFAADPGRAAAGFVWRRGRVGEGEALEVAIAQSVERELAATDDVEQLAIVRCEGVQRSDPPAVPVPGLVKSAQQLAERGVLVDTGQGIEVALGSFAWSRQCAESVCLLNASSRQRS